MPFFTISVYAPVSKQSVVGEKTGKALLSVDVDNTYIRLKQGDW